VFASWAIAINAIGQLAPQPRTAARRITWADVEPLRGRLGAAGLSDTSFAPFVERVHASNLRRVHEGDLDHLVFYALQSTHFTKLPPIEPALSAKAFVASLPDVDRDRFLHDGIVPTTFIPVAERARLDAMVRALRQPSDDPRLTYFRDLASASFGAADREARLAREYVRVMRFVYRKEFVAAHAVRPDEAVADLYRTRGLSTDTEVEAGYLVHLGLGIVKALSPERHVRRVLIVGPGLDLAPRTSLVEAGPPQSYQPWAVIDALLALGLADARDLEVVGADINPRVVDYIRRTAAHPPALHIVSGVRESDGVAFTSDYREYFERLGTAIGDVSTDDVTSVKTHRLARTIQVRPDIARVLHAEPLDIVTERLDQAFDVIIATNILPYFDDTGLMLALDNVAAMLAPGGVFLHNEARPMLTDVAKAVGLPFAQSRHVVIATVRGAPAPLGDSVWIHRRGG
jgi:hypothetical protein